MEAPIDTKKPTNETPSYSWVPIHMELADRLREYKDRSNELVDILVKTKAEGFPVISLEDKGDNDETIPLQEIDPITFFCNYNRAVTEENRKGMWKILKKELQLLQDVPSDFSGLPNINMQNARLFPWAKDRPRTYVNNGTSLSTFLTQNWKI